VQLLLPFIPDETEPVWVAWVAHVKYLDLIFARSFEVPAGILRLDALLLDAQAKFDAVPQYKGFFKPKHHYLSHVIPNIIELGPLPEYWCYSFEGFHQKIKRISRASNWKNVGKRIVKFWCYQFACLMGTHDEAERSRLSGIA